MIALEVLARDEVLDGRGGAFVTRGRSAEETRQRTRGGGKEVRRKQQERWAAAGRRRLAAAAAALGRAGASYSAWDRASGAAAGWSPP